NILTISSLETNQEKINNSKININTLVAELKTIFKQQFSDKNISFVCTATLPDNEVEIYSDKTKLIQILTNLISNAIKFTSNGEIAFGYQRKGDFLEFFVKDSGIGIPKEKQQLIFERFRQADISISEIYGGTGLGLSISKGFVELMGGKIWVESEPNKGASFYFTIPYIKATEQEIITNKETFDNTNELFGTILIAEDEEFNFLYIEQLLSNKVNKLIRAVNGKEAVELCKAHPDISLVLMDIKLPLMAGDVAAKIIKNFRPNLPILAQSAYALNQEIEQYRNVFDDYLTKPLEEEELISKLKKFLK
ncbi:MAG: response regulator, partial [Bacteroidales bacterium]|nr:response regulator [Bacteroidales bacterium]